MKVFQYFLCVAFLSSSIASNVDSEDDSVLLLQTAVDVTSTMDVGGLNPFAFTSLGAASTATDAGSDDVYAELGLAAWRDASNEATTWGNSVRDETAQAVSGLPPRLFTSRLAHAVDSDAAAYEDAGVLAPRLQGQAVVPSAATHAAASAAATARATVTDFGRAGFETDLKMLAERIDKLTNILAATEGSLPQYAAHVPHHIPSDVAPPAPMLVPDSQTGDASASVLANFTDNASAATPPVSLVGIASGLAHRTGRAATEITHKTGRLAKELASTANSLPFAVFVVFVVVCICALNVLCPGSGISFCS